jgi:hypothetical protein
MAAAYAMAIDNKYGSGDIGSCTMRMTRETQYIWMVVSEEKERADPQCSCGDTGLFVA